jgi:hypothetical protein
MLPKPEESVNMAWKTGMEHHMGQKDAMACPLFHRRVKF